MKFIKFITLIVLVLNITSCNNEPIDPKVVLNPTATVPVDPTSPTTPIITNPSGDFYPFALNNNWDFYNGTVSKNLKINTLETIDTKQYYKINKNFFFTNQPNYADSDITSHLRKDAGIYYQRISINKPEVFTPQTGTTPANSTSSGVVIQPYEMIFLKDAMAVGDTFTQTIPLSITTSTTSSSMVNSVLTQHTNHINSTSNLVVTIELVEKLPSVYVNGYLTSKIKTKTTITGIPGYQYNWFARDLGLVAQSNVNAIGTVTDYFTMTAFHLF